jgi:HNH endonuclease
MRPKTDSVSHYSSDMTKYTYQLLTPIVAASSSYSQVASALGVVNGTSRSYIANRIRTLGLDTSHFVTVWSSEAPNYPKLAAEILVLGTPGDRRQRTYILRRAMAQMGIPNRCAACGLSMWQSQPIPLEVHHINGRSWDNRLENLRLLCPNCHALTPSHSGRNRKVIRQCPGCDGPVSRRAPRCRRCSRKREAVKRPQQPWIAWPEDEVLIAKITASGSSYESVAREIGVSSNSIRKRLRRHNRALPLSGVRGGDALITAA